jgi:hypothetical protein
LRGSFGDKFELASGGFYGTLENVWGLISKCYRWHISKLVYKCMKQENMEPNDLKEIVLIHYKLVVWFRVQK